MERTYPSDSIRARLRQLGFPGVQHHQSVLRRLLLDFESDLPPDLDADELAERLIGLATRGALRTGPDFMLRRGPGRATRQFKRRYRTDGV
jgi:hypothetical protein